MLAAKPITDRQIDYPRQVQQQLVDSGIRATLDDSAEKVNMKIREAQLQQVPYMLVVGGREAENGTVSVRHRRHADMGVQPLAEFIATIRAQIDSKSTTD